MKTIYLTIIFVASLSFASIAQETSTSQTNDNSYRTLFNSSGGPIKVSGFGSFNINMMSLDNKVAGAAGFDGAVLINRSFYLGFYGRGSFGTPHYDIYSTDTLRNIEKASTFFHTGLIIGANFMANKPIHFGFSTKLGGGAYVLYNDYEHYYSNNNNNCNSYDNDVAFVGPLFVITPQVDVEMNITNWMKFKVGFGYQWVNSSTLSYDYKTSAGIIENKSFNTNKLSSPVAEISFIFGWFK